jgi:death on curing protein
MIQWPHPELAVAIHDRVIAASGGHPGVRDPSLLEFTLARPQQLFAIREPQPDLADLAANIAFGIARNHPFMDANKRTALVAYRTFLALNDAELRASAEEKFVTIMKLAAGQLSEKRFAEWLRERIRIVQPRTVPKARTKKRSAEKKPAKKKARPR